MRYGWSLDRPPPIYVRTADEIQELHNKMSSCSLLALDTETTGLDIARDYVVFWSVSTGDDRYFLERNTLCHFTDIWDDPTKTWIGSQIKYDANMMANSGHPLAGDLACTLTMDRLIDPGRDHGLKSRYEQEFGERMMSFGETFFPVDAKGKPRKPPKKPMYEILLEAFTQDPDRVIDYASLDSWSVFRLFERQREHLQDLYTYYGVSLYSLFVRYEMPFSRVLYEMERRGVQIDRGYLNEIEPKIEQEMLEISAEINQMAGYPLNINSGPQLADLLYGRMGIKPLAKTPGGAPSTNKAVLKAHAEEGIKVAQRILEHRKLAKLLGTYVRGLREWSEIDGRVHTTFNQHVADTARLSSSDPALQNQPRSGSGAFDIRRAFIAPPGYTMLVADYDQLEMYIAGSFSRAKALVDAAWSGRDIHTTNVEAVYGEPYDEVKAAKAAKDKTERQKYLAGLRNDVKAVGFGQTGRRKTCSKRGNLSATA